jgi:hypothetical protein
MVSGDCTGLRGSSLTAGITALGRSAQDVGRCTREAGQVSRGALDARRGSRVGAGLEAAQGCARSSGEAEERIRPAESRHS